MMLREADNRIVCDDIGCACDEFYLDGPYTGLVCKRCGKQVTTGRRLASPAEQHGGRAVWHWLRRRFGVRR